MSTILLSSTARHRVRHRLSRRLRIPNPLDHALHLLASCPSLANAFHAWLVYLHQSLSTAQHRSASNFSRVFQLECIRSYQDPTICDHHLITPDFLSATIHEFAAAFIVDKNIERPSKIARIGSNLSSFLVFLSKQSFLTSPPYLHQPPLLPLPELQKLHNYALELGSSMIRSARAERVGEAYSQFVRDHYGALVGDIENVTLFNGGFEVAHVAQRFCLLSDGSDSGLDHTAFARVDPVKVRFPHPMTKQLKVGDQVHLEIRRLDNGEVDGRDVWVPTECYGVYPEYAEEEDARMSRTPTERTGLVKNNSDSPPVEVEEIIRLLENHCSPALQCQSDDRSLHSGSHQHAEEEHQNSQKDLEPDEFDESKFTEEFFTSMEIDIGDHDTGFGIHEFGSESSEGSDGDETE